MQTPQLLHKLLRTRRNKDIFIFFLFFLLAALLWFGHALQSVRTTRVPVYIHYTGKPGNIGLTKEGLPDQVIITVRDAGHRLNTYHQNPPQITIDLHQYIHGESGTILIPANDLRASIKAVLQDNSNLLSASPDEIRCGYFKEADKTVSLVFTGSVSPADGYQQLGEPTLAKKKIKIFGQKEVIRKIDTLYTEEVAFTNLTDSLEKNVALVVPQGVRAEMDSVTLTLPIEQYTERRMTIPIVARGVPDGTTLRLFPNEVDVNMRIGISHFDEIKEEDIHAYCYFPALPQVSVEVKLSYPKNPHVTSVWYYPTEVQYIKESSEEREPEDEKD